MSNNLQNNYENPKLHEAIQFEYSSKHHILGRENTHSIVKKHIQMLILFKKQNLKNELTAVSITKMLNE